MNTNEVVYSGNFGQEPVAPPTIRNTIPQPKNSELVKKLLHLIPELTRDQKERVEAMTPDQILDLNRAISEYTSITEKSSSLQKYKDMETSTISVGSKEIGSDIEKYLLSSESEDIRTEWTGLADQQRRSIIKFASNFIHEDIASRVRQKVPYSRNGNGIFNPQTYTELIDTLKSHTQLKVDEEAVAFEMNVMGKIYKAIDSPLLGAYQNEFNEIENELSSDTAIVSPEMKTAFMQLKGICDNSMGQNAQIILKNLEPLLKSLENLDRNNPLELRIAEAIQQLKETLSRLFGIPVEKTRDLTQTASRNDHSSLMAMLALQKAPKVLESLNGFIRDYVDSLRNLTIRLNSVLDLNKIKAEQGRMKQLLLKMIESADTSDKAAEGDVTQTTNQVVEAEDPQTANPMIGRLTNTKNRLKDFIKVLRQDDYGQYELVNSMTELEIKEDDSEEIKEIKSDINDLIYTVKEIGRKSKETEPLYTQPDEQKEILLAESSIESADLSPDQKETDEPSIDLPYGKEREDLNKYHEELNRKLLSTKLTLKEEMTDLNVQGQVLKINSIPGDTTSLLSITGFGEGNNISSVFIEPLHPKNLYREEISGKPFFYRYNAGQANLLGLVRNDGLVERFLVIDQKFIAIPANIFDEMEYGSEEKVKDLASIISAL